jgi:hypothetical protein
MEDQRIIEFNIRHYKELLKLDRHTDTTRQRVIDLLVDAQAQLPLVEAMVTCRERH